MLDEWVMRVQYFSSFVRVHCERSSLEHNLVGDRIYSKYLLQLLMDTAKSDNDHSVKKLIKSHALHTKMGKESFIQLAINFLFRTVC